MPLNVRTIAIRTAVIFFFVLSLLGWSSGLEPFTCCKKAVAGAVLAYIAAAVAVKIVNVVLINALVNKQMQRKQEENSGDSED